LVFNKTARNFNPDIAGAAKVTIAEVEQIVDAGKLDPDEIHVPGIFVDYIWKPKSFQRRHEKVVFSHHSEHKLNELKLTAREIIAKRLAKEVKDGMYVNLGIGIPTLMPHYLDPKVKIEMQSENGILGVGDYPEPG
jgi:3-oxoacid CoA-transferase